MVSFLRPHGGGSARCSQRCWPSTPINQVPFGFCPFNCHFRGNMSQISWRCFDCVSCCLPLALWIMAAKSELEERNSSESARHLFLRALRFHPGNRKLYQEVGSKNMSHFHTFWHLKKKKQANSAMCCSTSAWSCYTVRSWGSRRKSWKRLKLTLWVGHHPEVSILTSLPRLKKVVNMFI